ncbi:MULTISPECIES: MinD/ParA family protein [Reinekea]|mgnify:CR=1 FL=1|jgi:flagellar biosynthesis protein FlhG|uniref:Flagellar synthesis regulator FleN n=1 Tax=Reinekea forsetii TaxID=1336806 RepID=A0A2K8KRE9_9GAMM|nr:MULTISPECIES: MinD/ParA family protein [Reinekea]ATX77300.1 flagellar synthesis regulator FleN [Reinekea forsetii]MDO7643541.1 MinD/ParA family protein [Reinekea forsetii]
MKSLNPIQVIAVTGGKGGVGKSNVSVNLAIGLAELGKRVVLLDADLGLANLDVLLGLSVNRNLGDVLSGQASLLDIMVEGPAGIKIIPASSGSQHMTNLGEVEHAGIITAFSDLGEYMDVLIVDTAAGISKTVTSFVRAAHEALIVVTDEPTSVTDCYALIKVLNRDCRMNRFRIAANMVRTPKEGQMLFNKLAKVTDRFLDVSLQYSGAIPMDEAVRKSVQRQKAVLEAYPRSKASVAYRDLAQKVIAWPLPSSPKGNLEFFVERLIQGVGAA